MKYLIVNADDFGYSELYNKKILELIESGAVTSTTVLVNRITSNQSGQIKNSLNFLRR